MRLVIQYLAIGLAGSLGAMLRCFVTAVCHRTFGWALPVGTFVINITGSFFLGWFLVAMRDRATVSDTMQMAVSVGFVGAYTTFSTFAYETNGLLEQGAWIRATLNMVGSLLVGLLAVRMGIWVARLE